MGEPPVPRAPADGPAPSSQSSNGSETTFFNGEERVEHETMKIHHTEGNQTVEYMEEQEHSHQVEMERRQSAVQSLARQYTQRSNVGGHIDGHSPFTSDDPMSPLNPHGEKFNARTWARTIANITSEHGGGYRTAGVCFQNLNVFGYGADTDYQKDVGNVLLEAPKALPALFGQKRGLRRVDILRDFNGVIEAGEMCIVLGPPGAGCSTFLKTLSGEMNGIYTDPSTYLNYQELSAKEMHKHHAGDAIYTAEVDVHFPMLSVGETLAFASRARCPRTLPEGISRDEYCGHLRDVVMAMYGISHTVNTRVGNEYIRGVSGKYFVFEQQYISCMHTNYCSLKVVRENVSQSPRRPCPTLPFSAGTTPPVVWIRQTPLSFAKP